MIMLLTFIWNVSGSTLSGDTDYLDTFLVLFLFYSVKRRDMTLN